MLPDPSLQAVEVMLRQPVPQPADPAADSLREVIAKAMRAMLPADAVPPTATIADCVEAATAHPSARRGIALFLLRILDAPGLLRDGRTNGTHLERKIVALVEQGARDLADHVRLGEHKLTNEKLDALQALHSETLERLKAFRGLPQEPTEFASRRQDLFKLLANKPLRAYLNPYGYVDLENTAKEVLNGICDLLDTSDSTFGSKLQALIEVVERELTAAQNRVDFVALDALVPFLERSREVLTRIDKESSGRFACALRPRRAPSQVLEKRYPLHEPDRTIRIRIPVVNEGPGVAIDTIAQLVAGSDDVLFVADRIELGNVAPGEFTISVEMFVGAPMTEVSILVELSWRTARAPERHTASFDTILLGQKPDIPWDELEASDPYTTEVAHGTEFVGRRGKVLALVNRFRKARMQSSYITGQKRVGKTSLAFAVQDVLGQEAAELPIKIVYLEYGDYARKDADATVESLGQAIATQLLPELPADRRPGTLDFRGSLAPLSQIAGLLAQANPNQRYLIILDEFDEIHPDMYRFGPLAEAFFSNLRTLSAKPNVAVMLVGGENMPFIISAQGDQLNKFVREPLDYFSRSDEWEDFADLARQKGTLPLNWHESALSELFNYTNGHPYYTKLLCARIFQNAVTDRDAEVTVDEVQRAAPSLIETLDTNAFAHFWKDGIPAGREEAEVVELKRCRVLVAIARTRRQGKMLTAENVAEHRGAVGLANSDVVPVLTDFCRRDILRERGREYEFVLPLFEQWLVARGVSKLIADTLGDEMADALQSAEDQAYVTSPEIAALVDRWPVYRGRRVGAEDVRRWLGQRPSFQDQRLLFKLLQNLRFMSEEEMREKLRVAHSIVKRHTTAFTPETRSQRRYDIIITYVDGPAKSGSRYAARYAEENLVSTTCVTTPEDFERRVAEHEDKRGIVVNGVLIIDDIAATGHSLAGNVVSFVERHQKFLKDRNITVVVVALLATRESDEYLRDKLKQVVGVDIDFRACEVLGSNHFAFGATPGIWADASEAARAKALVTEIGRDIYKGEPLGFGDLGLLVVFGETCPNNSLPILHSGNAGRWQPLFERPKN